MLSFIQDLLDSNGRDAFLLSEKGFLACGGDSIVAVRFASSVMDITQCQVLSLSSSLMIVCLCFVRRDALVIWGDTHHVFPLYFAPGLLPSPLVHGICGTVEAFVCNDTLISNL